MPFHAAVLHWNVEPDLLEIGPVTLRYYGICFALAFLSGFFIMRWMFRRENVPERELDPLLICMLLGTVIGARLGHCFFYRPDHFLSHPLEILQVWKGGLASHGGAAGILVSLYIYARTRRGDAAARITYVWILDRMVLPVALGGALIRVGNFFNSEIIGVPADVPWSVVFERVDAAPRHPAQLYESLAYALIFLLLVAIYRRTRSDPPRGLLAGVFLLAVFSARFLIEFVKERQAAQTEDLPMSMGQMLSLPLILAGATIIVAALKRRPRRPGRDG
jgi:prolipoprotein diacylglyceryl transferase